MRQRFLPQPVRKLAYLLLSDVTASRVVLNSCPVDSSWESISAVRGIEIFNIYKIPSYRIAERSLSDEGPVKRYVGTGQ